MYKVFINQRTIYLAGNIDLSCIISDNQPYECTNRIQVENAFANFVAEPSKSSLFLFYPEHCDELFQYFSSLFSYIEASGGLVKDPTGRLLFINRLGYWDLPKGKIEKGEDPPTAALREVSEETGLNAIEIIKPLPDTYHIFERKGKLRLKQTNWFEMSSRKDGPLYPQLDEEISEARWFEKHELAEPLSNTYPAIRELVEEYLSKLF